MSDYISQLLSALDSSDPRGDISLWIRKKSSVFSTMIRLKVSRRSMHGMRFPASINTRTANRCPPRRRSISPPGSYSARFPASSVSDPFWKIADTPYTSPPTKIDPTRNLTRNSSILTS